MESNQKALMTVRLSQADAEKMLKGGYQKYKLTLANASDTLILSSTATLTIVDTSKIKNYK